MTTREHIGGYIVKIRYSYLARFYNPITYQTENLGYGTEEECIEIYINKQVEFYNQHKYLLPKSIGLTLASNGKYYFKLGFNITQKYGKNKFIHIGTYKILQEAVEAKQKLVNIIID